ncbi:unnamed protein product [Caenorhabditis bovis]|nr:unnamed protein product [Caenorhabditis bovis]
MLAAVLLLSRLVDADLSNRNLTISPQDPTFHYVNISLPAAIVRIRCNHCDVQRCRPLPFCYSIVNRENERSRGDYCADMSQMSSLVGAQLDATTSSARRRRRIADGCLPSIADSAISYCVCRTFNDDT